jgi:biopolymer transport protein ExbD
MIARPLDLASKLRRPPRSYDWMFFVNFGLIALLFVLFGSRFVLSPALTVNGDRLSMPTMPAGSVNLVPSTLLVSVKSNGQIFVDPQGLMTFAQLEAWMKDQIKRTPGARLLIRADARVPFDDLSKISAAAAAVGLAHDLAVEPMKSGAEGGAHPEARR